VRVAARGGDEAMTLPIACDLTPEAIRAGRAGLLPGLAARAISREETPDGYRLTFAASSETLTAIMLVMDAERQCCRWIRFKLVVEPDNGAMVLTLSGPAGARGFLSALFAL
jgi:hypothetical protein